MDYEKTFDSVETLPVLNAIRQDGKESYCRILEDLYTQSPSNLIDTEKVPM